MHGSIEYLLELRRRLLRYLLIFFIVSCVTLVCAQWIYHVVALPMLRSLGGNVSLIAISIPAPFLVPMKTALMAALFLTLPYLLFQIWNFIAPGLYRNEKYFAGLLLITSSILFYAGVAFSYFIVLPIIFKFMLAIAPIGVEVRPDISQYYDFVLRMFLAFGFAFEVPVLILLLVKYDLCSLTTLAAKRPYVIVVAFILGMLLTPPDVISQILLALPLWLLYECGLGLARLLVHRRSIRL